MGKKILIDLPEDVHKQVRVLAALANMSVKGYVESVVGDNVKKAGVTIGTN